MMFARHPIAGTRRGRAGPVSVPSDVGNTALKTFIESHQELFVLIGAWCTNSGIPDYRDHQDNWNRAQPVRFQAFKAEELTCQRYWARSDVDPIFEPVARSSPKRVYGRLV